jgi:MAP/microtubule affinity-regulating kinase
MHCTGLRSYCLYVGVYDVPSGVGHGAERVLKGCLERSVSNRWTIAMVDELAWGIGWGSEGDDVTTADSDDEFESCHSSFASLASAPHSRHPEPTFPENFEWQQEDRRSRPSLEVASHRSTSRVRRSLSRAPVTPRRSSSKGSILGRSISRHSPPRSPSLSALSSAILGNGSNTGSSSASPFYDSALVISPYLDRGRRLKKPRGRSPSRSPSPAPATPTDSRLSVSVEMGETRSDDIEHEAPRGRKKHSRGIPPLRPDQLYSPEVDPALEFDLLDETAHWTKQKISSRRSSSAPWRRQRPTGTFRDSRVRSCDRWAYQEKRFKSSPPSSYSNWSALTGGNGLGIFVPIPRSRRGPQTSGGDIFLTASKSTSALTRSRSVEFERSDEESYLRQP